MVEFCRSNPAGLPVTVNPRVVRHSPPFQSGVVVPTSRFATRRLAPAETGKRTLPESKYLPVFPESCRYKPLGADEFLPVAQVRRKTGQMGVGPMSYTRYKAFVRSGSDR